MMVGREGFLGLVLDQRHGDFQWVARWGRPSTAYRVVRMGYAGLGGLVRGTGNPMPCHSQLVLALEHSFLDLD